MPPAAVATNGYDFSNSVDGDTYIFLLGDSLDGWYEARKDFLLLTGPTPLLPDFTVRLNLLCRTLSVARACADRRCGSVGRLVHVVQLVHGEPGEGRDRQLDRDQVAPRW